MSCFGVRPVKRVPHRLQEVDLGVGAGADLLEVLVAGLLGPLQLVLLGRRRPRARELGLVLLVALARSRGRARFSTSPISARMSASSSGEVLVAALVVDPRDDVRGEVDDLLEALRRDVEQVAETARDTLEVPDVGDRGGELDVAHALAADLRARDLDATALADDPLEPDALVLAAVALPVLGRPEDLLAEQAVLLGLERAVVDRLRLLDLAVRPRADLVRGGERDRELGGVVDVEHQVASLLLRRLRVRASVVRCVTGRLVRRAGAGAARLPRRCPARAG